MTREEIMQLNTDYLNGCESEHKMNELFNYVLELQKHEQQSSNTVSRGVFEQVMWERDVAINQLKELGYGFGEKIKTDKDAISRQAALDAMSDTWKHICSVARRKHPTKGEEAVYSDMWNTVRQIQPVTPQQKIGHWIEDEYEMKVRCSECGEDNDECSKYCPNC